MFARSDRRAAAARAAAATAADHAAGNNNHLEAASATTALGSAGGGGGGAPSSTGGTTTTLAPPPPEPAVSFQRLVTSIDSLTGDSIEARIESLIGSAAVVVVGPSPWCPYTCDSIELLADDLQVVTHVLHLNAMPQSKQEIVQHLQSKTGRRHLHTLLPAIFVKGQYMGGCEDLMRWHHMGSLERDILRGLVNRPRSVHTESLDTAGLAPVHRSPACLPLLLHPHTVNNHVSRVTALFVFTLSTVGASFFYRYWEKYIALALFVDFALRLVGGDALSPLATLATFLVSWKAPNFRPGAGKQLDVLVGFLLCGLTLLCSFLELPGHDIGACVLFMLIALQAASEGFFKISLGHRLVEPLIRFGIMPNHVYRVYNRTRPETSDTYFYTYTQPASIPKPIKITTNRTSLVALKYKKKSPEWKLHDWDPIRHCHVHYLYCPLSLAALAMAFKISADTKQILGEEMQANMRLFVVPDAWFSFIACYGAFVLVFMLFLYMTKVMLYPLKIRKERTHPVRGTGLATISIALMIFGFLCYDQLIETNSQKDSPAQVLGRVFYWFGSVSHALVTVAAVANWIGRPFSLENVHPHLLIYPIGLATAAFTAPVVAPLPENSRYSLDNFYIARFYFSFGWLLWMVVFALTFLRVVVKPTPDNRMRHGIWFFLATPCTMALAQFFICLGRHDNTQDNARDQCVDSFDEYYFASIFLFGVLLWTGAPHVRFTSVESFNMWYWVDCFSLGMLSTCAATFYVATGWESAAILEFVFLLIATAVNTVAMMHTLTCLMRKHHVCTSEVKLRPLTFLGLAHDAIRCHFPTLQYYLQFLNLDDDSDEAQAILNLFVAHFNRFRIAHGEHARHEDTVLYRTYREYFPYHGKKWSDEHKQNSDLIDGDWSDLVEAVRDPNSASRREALQELRHELPAFFAHLSRHFRGEEENMDPIFKKHLPLALQEQLAREIFLGTPAEQWEVLIPFVLTNLPRHEQRVRYLQSLCWAIPERAQQVGAIVYRNVDPILWLRLRFDFPEMVPRGVPGWRRQY